MQIQQSAAPLRTGIQTDAARGSYTAQSRPEPARKNSSGDSIQRLHRAPAAGFRNASSGALLSVGERGYAWSSSTYGADDPSASRLRFIADFVGPVHTDNRSYGFSVRCVQHLQGCLTGRSREELRREACAKATVSLRNGARDRKRAFCCCGAGLPTVRF